MLRKYTVSNSSELDKIFADLKAKKPELSTRIETCQKTGNVDELVEHLSPEEIKLAGIEAKTETATSFLWKNSGVTHHPDALRDPDNFRTDGKPVSGVTLKVY